MAETEIPEDVMRAAEAAQDAAMARCKAAKFAVYEYPFGTGRAKDVLDEEIARAILAERERCAMVAEAYGDGGTDYDLEPEAAVATSVASKFIASSIRGDHHG